MPGEWPASTLRGMNGTLILLLLTGAVIALWLDALSARELAGRRSRELCEKADLQWLDQSVVLQRIWLTRVNGRLAFGRKYRFEVSFDGSDRHRASISMSGKRVINYALPHREPD
ncbi:DUF3301 domain-containing protein [Dokdonella sp.]|uniref:DUF3301 domain-containing protein n=1 Tax=Dokdonella sp. TaxID=2291710 RepID=UPI003C6B7759